MGSACSGLEEDDGAEADDTHVVVTGVFTAVAVTKIGRIFRFFEHFPVDAPRESIPPGIAGRGG
ncbi:MAG: hypothetical protein HGA58_01695 [Chlorobiaceae bacterium]|jgi:hypothetical protein|nr:hypothetical protein [Chlorobiaceae bacterium]